MADAVSAAIAPTLPMAAMRVAAIDCSAAASRSWSSASSRLVGRLGGGRLLLAGFGGDRLRPSAGIGERFLVSGVSGVGLLLEAMRRFEIVADALCCARRRSRRCAGKRHLGHQHVEQHEAHRQPGQLRRKVLGLERRKRGVPGGRLAMGGRLGHDGGFLQPEQQQKRDQQREDTERLGDGEAEIRLPNWPWAAEGFAQRGGQIVAEDDTHADAGAAHADTGNAGRRCISRLSDPCESSFSRL